MKCFLIYIVSAFLMNAVCVAKSVAPTPQTSHPKDLSNILPLNIVQSLMSKGLWSDELEQNENPEGKIIVRFYSEILDAKESPQTVADELFDDQSVVNGFSSKSHLYSVKVVVFREALAVLPEARQHRLESAVLEKYFNLTVALINFSKVTEMNPILNQAKQLVNTNTVQLVDLNSGLLGQISNEKTSHRFDPSNVHGLYIPSRKLLAIDISKSISENIITLSHELVHMADPEQEANRIEMQNLFPALISRLAKNLGTESEAEKIANSLLRDVYFEIGDLSLLSVIDQIQKKRVTSLKAQIGESQDAELSEDPVLKNWNQLLVKTTIENELKAYLYSLAVYQSLRTDSKILPSSEDRDANILRICDENFSFARSLSAAQNPFISSTHLGVLYAGKETQSDELKNKVNLLKGALEFHYLTEMRSALSSYSMKYASIISFLKERMLIMSESADGAQDEVLPRWAQPGQLESSINPYTILTAKLSTAWVVRFKQSISALVKDIEKIGEPILLMKMGLLDLHDITFGELKLLGIQSKDSTSIDLPRMLGADLRTDLSVEGLAFVKYMNLSDWRPTDFSTRGVISQADLQSSLYRLRLLKLLSWLETKFPIAAENLTSIKILQNQILEGVYDHNELDKQRIQQLKQELVETAKAAAFTSTDLTQINYLMKVVGGFYTLTKASDWYVITSRYQKKMKSAIRLLESNGYNSEFNSVQFETNFNQQLATFTKSIREEYAFCLNNNEMQFIPSPHKFSAFNYSFPLTTVCHNKNIYIFRRPGDLNESATTFIVNGRPESRIFFGSRPVRLEPFIGVRNSFLKDSILLN